MLVVNWTFYDRITAAELSFAVECDFKPQQMRRKMMDAMFEFMIRCWGEKQAERKNISRLIPAGLTLIKFSEA